MMLLHGLLLVFSIITVAPMIVFSMALPSPRDSEDEPQPPIDAVPVRLCRSEEIEKIPVYARRLNPSPFR